MDSLVTDSLTPSGVSAPDAILTCAVSRMTIASTDSDAGALLAFPINNGPLTIYQSSAGTVLWSE